MEARDACGCGMRVGGCGMDWGFVVKLMLKLKRLKLKPCISWTAVGTITVVLRGFAWHRDMMMCGFREHASRSARVALQQQSLSSAPLALEAGNAKDWGKTLVGSWGDFIKCMLPIKLRTSGLPDDNGDPWAIEFGCGHVNGDAEQA
jgi:hypothetical protein